MRNRSPDGPGPLGSDWSNVTTTKPKRRPIESRLPQGWQRHRQRKRARLAKMSRPKRVWRRIGLTLTWLLGLIAAMVAAAVVLFYTLSDVPQPADLSVPQVAVVEYSDGSTMARIGSSRPDHRSADQGAGIRALGRARRRGPQLLLRARCLDHRHPARGPERRDRRQHPGRFRDHPAVRQERLSQLGADAQPEAQGTGHRGQAVPRVLQGPDPRVLSEHGVLRPQCLRRRGGAEAYFGTSVDRLGPAQGAVLAALLRAPNYYDPANNPAEARARWSYVVKGMVETKHLTETQAAGLTFPKIIAPDAAKKLGATGPTALLVQQVIDELEANGISKDEIDTRGLRIRTTIDRKAQQAALNAVSADLRRPDRSAKEHEERAGRSEPTDRRGARLLRRAERQQLRRQARLQRLCRPWAAARRARRSSRTRSPPS